MQIFRTEVIPFYGGGKGQSLQVSKYPNGTIVSEIIKTPPVAATEEVNPAELEHPQLPSKQEIDPTYNLGFNIQNIHRTALNVIKLQEIARRGGKLNAEQEEDYKQNMESLNVSAQNLAKIQGGVENREGLEEWFERRKSSKKDKDKKKKEEEEKKKEEEEKKKKEEGEKKKKEENKEEEEEVEENEDDDDAISIGLPSDEASVAEAKPVGLAIAGEGGVAASKPIATAVVGPGGLAIARPVGTAIAGVSPEQALVPIYAEGYLGATKPKRYNTGAKTRPDNASEYLNKIISKYHQV